MALVCLWGSLAILSLPHPRSVVLFYAVDLLLFVGSCWVLGKGVRLIGGQPVEGGLIGRTGLHVTAWIFLLIPVAAMLAGTFWKGPVLLKLLQAAAYVSAFFTLRGLDASRRTANPGDEPGPHTQ
ncbi:MAG TPA: hypothetical protein VM096_08675 [Vicinamibacterales bacterium]|nr:hypothetical protein [Vicinamibacterales bacterium]